MICHLGWLLSCRFWRNGVEFLAECAFDKSTRHTTFYVRFRNGTTMVQSICWSSKCQVMPCYIMFCCQLAAGFALRRWTWLCTLPVRHMWGLHSQFYLRWQLWAPAIAVSSCSQFCRSRPLRWRGSSTDVWLKIFSSRAACPMDRRPQCSMPSRMLVPGMAGPSPMCASSRQTTPTPRLLGLRVMQSVLAVWGLSHWSRLLTCLGMMKPRGLLRVHEWSRNSPPQSLLSLLFFNLQKSCTSRRETGSSMFWDLSFVQSGPTCNLRRGVPCAQALMASMLSGMDVKDNDKVVWLDIIPNRPASEHVEVKTSTFQLFSHLRPLSKCIYPKVLRTSQVCWICTCSFEDLAGPCSNWSKDAVCGLDSGREVAGYPHSVGIPSLRQLGNLCKFVQSFSPPATCQLGEGC